MGFEDRRDRRERHILREFRQLYVLRNGSNLSCITFGDYVVEMVLKSFFIGRELGLALGEVDAEGGEAVGLDVNFLVVGHLSHCAGEKGQG